MDKPILFSAPMVRAILRGDKTMTRREIKLPTKGEYVRPDMGGWAPSTIGGGGAFRFAKDGSRIPASKEVVIWNQTTGTCLAMKYRGGDRLWVRETWFPMEAQNGQRNYGYAADFTGEGRPNCNYKPSIHMPRTASRITLEVTAVKIERLQDISEDDAKAEGVECDSDGWRDYMMPNTQCRPTAKDSFETLWESINGPGSWEVNPWVAAYSFKRIEQ